MSASGKVAASAGGEVRAGLADRLWRLRDRVLSDPSFLRISGSTMLGRAIGRREAAALFDVAAGFVYAQVLSAVIRLDLLETLRDGPLAPGELARRLDLPVRSMDRLLIASEPLRLVARRGGGRWGLGYRGAAVLGNPGLVAMVRHHDILYRELADPVALLRRGGGTEMGAFWPYARGAGDVSEAEVADYSRLMSASQHFIADEVMAAYPFGRHRHVLDVGGGEGTFALALAARHPALRVTVLDLPAVAERARGRFASSGHGDRLAAVDGDFIRSALPPGADAVTLLRVVHDHDDEVALALLRRVAEALPPEGRLVLAEPMAGAPAAPGIASYFAFYLLAMGSGRPRTAGELATLLHRAGFRTVRRRPERNPTVTRVLVARR